jgi:hypothetical protein
MAATPGGNLRRLDARLGVGDLPFQICVAVDASAPKPDMAWDYCTAAVDPVRILRFVAITGGPNRFSGSLTFP